MTATIIIVANDRIPVDDLNLIIEHHRSHRLSPKVAVAYVGELRDKKITADVVVVVPGSMINLGRCRNLAAKACPADWFMFADGDTYYTKELGNFIKTGNLVLRGRWRADVNEILGPDVNAEYHVMAAPMMITSDLFRMIGGYHEGFSNYGHDDSDIDWKLADSGIDVQLVNTGAKHVLPIHNLFGGNNWDRGRNANRALFEARLAKPIAERIVEDVAVFSS